MYVDIVFGAILVATVYRGYRVGMAAQIIQITALVTGLIAAEPLTQQFFPEFARRATFIDEPLRRPILFFSSWIGGWLIISVVATILLGMFRRRIYGENKPTLGDRVFGMGLGVAKGAFAAAVIAYGIEAVPENIRQQPMIAQQLAGSQALRQARQFDVVPKVLAVLPFQQLQRYVGDLAVYFRKPADGAAIATDLGRPAAEASIVPRVATRDR